MTARRPAQGVLLVGTFPPPIDGMSVVNVAILEALRRRGAAVEAVDSSGRGLSGPSYHARRTLAHARAMRRALAPGGARLGTLCHGVNAGAGMVYTLALVAAARAAGMRIVLYYHSSNYIRRRSRLLGLIVRIAGAGALHAIASEDMADRLRALYPTVSALQVIDNCAYVADLEPPRRAVREPVRIGLLSNLMMEKGLGLAISCARELKRRGVDCRLILAGPLVGEDAQVAAAGARRDLGEGVEFRGTVLGEAKRQFYRDIDIFLFPSLYPHETQSIVVPEAMAGGMPVLVHDHAFIRNLFAGAGVDHLLLPSDGSFPIHAAEAIAAWLADPAGYARDAALCRRRFDELRAKGAAEFERFIAQIAPPRTGAAPDAAGQRRIAMR